MVEFIKSRTFIIGFVLGLFVATAATFIIFSVYSYTSGKNQLSSTMYGRQLPIGTTRVVLDVLLLVECPSYSGIDYAVALNGYDDAVICTGLSGLTENQQIIVSDYIDNCSSEIYISGVQ